ncbi:MAG: hypothetical protein R6U66_07490 [Bacteroidales bacterium]
MQKIMTTRSRIYLTAKFGASVILLFTLLSTHKSIAQKLTLHGYQKYMNTTLFSEPKDPWLVDNMLHNRMKLNWFPSSSVTFNLEARTRLIYGDFINKLPGYARGIEQQNGYFNLSHTFSSGPSYLLHSNIDRANINWNINNFSVTLGRQRINWAQTYVFNPNDIFNSYSFFDFDYEEKPGADAFRLQYYPNYTSVAEVVAKIDQNEKVTLGAYYRFNKWSYDWQLLGGMLQEQNWVAGFGWAGAIKQVGFTGEVTLIAPKNTIWEDAKLLASSGLNYFFSNSLQLQGEIFYNAYAKMTQINSLTSFYNQTQNIKNLSFSEWSWFLQASYPIHPLLQGTLGAMYYPDYEMYFLMPSFSYSLADNYELAIYAQRFSGDFGSGISDQLNLVFLRFRWSF